MIDLPPKELPLDQQELIRKFLLKTIAIPGAALTIIVGLAGYIIGQAVNAGVVDRTEQFFTDKMLPLITDKMLPPITDAANKAGFADGQATSAANAAAAILKDTQEKAAAIGKAQNDFMQTTRTYNDAINKNFDALATTLVGNPGFKDALAKAAQSDISAIKDELAELKITKINQLTAPRQFITIYTNYTSRTRIVMVSAALPKGMPPSFTMCGNVSQLQSLLQPKCQGSSPSAVASSFSGGGEFVASMTFVVPAGYFYNVSSDGALPNVSVWAEADL